MKRLWDIEKPKKRAANDRQPSHHASDTKHERGVVLGELFLTQVLL